VRQAYDLFLCHASEDKEDVARPLATALRERGWAIWFDEFELTMGDVLGREIDRGLVAARFGVVLLSPSFFRKEWARRELDGLTVKEVGEGEKVILPVWHDLDAKYVARYSPPLAAKLAPNTSEGIDALVAHIERALARAGLIGPGGGPKRAEPLDPSRSQYLRKPRASRRPPRLASPPPPTDFGGEGEDDPPLDSDVARTIAAILAVTAITTVLLIIIIRFIDG
jgi:hypothetical protein